MFTVARIIKTQQEMRFFARKGRARRYRRNAQAGKIRIGVMNDDDEKTEIKVKKKEKKIETEITTIDIENVFGKVQPDQLKLIGITDPPFSCKTGSFSAAIRGLI